MKPLNIISTLVQECVSLDLAWSRTQREEEQNKRHQPKAQGCMGSKILQPNEDETRGSVLLTTAKTEQMGAEEDRNEAKASLILTSP